MDRSTLKLTELTDAILSQMDASGFMESTRGVLCNPLQEALPHGERKGG